MYAAAGGASLAGRKARQHGRGGAPASPRPRSPAPPAPAGVRAYSCQHWEARVCLSAPVPPLSAAPVPPARAAPAPGAHAAAAECASGRAAWQEAAARALGAGHAGAGGAARRCSVLGDHPTARRDPRQPWPRKNRVRDASYGSSSESEGEAEGAPGEPYGVARLLYAGLAILALGLVVYFVGTGDKGFKTPALRLVGPSLIFTGLGCCLLRIAFCVFAKPCCKRRNAYKETRRLSNYGYGESTPLAGSATGEARGERGARGPAQCSPARRLDASSCDVSSLSSGEEDERLRRYRIEPHAASTRQTTSSHSTVHHSSVHAAPASAPQGLPRSPHYPHSPHTPLSPHAPLSPLSPHTPQTSTPRMPNVPSPAATPTNLHTNVICAIPSAIPSTSAVSSASTIHSASAIPGTSTKQSARPIRNSSASVVPSTSAIPSASALLSPSAIPSTSTNIASSLQQLGQRRPTARNVSFANGPEEELVLSPAQLRS